MTGCFNNTAEYEAVIVKLELSLQTPIATCKQPRGEYNVKKAVLVLYHKKAAATCVVLES